MVYDFVENVLPKEWYSPLFKVLARHIEDPVLREIWIFGGKGSAKTFSVCQLLEFLAHTKGESSLVFRKESASIKTTLKGTFEKSLVSFDLQNEFEVLNFEIRHKIDSKIVLKGLDKSYKVKGAEGFKYFMLDELDQFAVSDYSETTGALRGNEGAKIIATWNPVSSQSFIKTDFIDKIEWIDTDDKLPSESSYVRKSLDGSKLLIFTTYPDNYWCVGSPCGSYGFRDSGYINYLESKKVDDPRWYSINVLGHWGEPQNDAPYFEGFDYTKQVGKAIYNPYHPIVEVGLDFNNYKKGCSMVIRQTYEPNDPYSVFENKAKGGVMILEALQDDIPNLANYLVKNYGANHRIHITGDSSGKNLGASNMSYFAMFEAEVKNAYWAMYKSYGDFVIVANSYNIRHEQSKLLCQKIHRYYGENYIVDEQKAAKLITDFAKCKLTETGQYDKTHAERNKYGDVSDAERYCIAKFQKNIAYSIGELDFVENV